jgi:polyhydroxybutyrate depolymerase
MRHLLSAVLVVAVLSACDSTSPATPDGGNDAGAADAGPRDAGGDDAGLPDAGLADAGTPDAGAPDAGIEDAGLPDGGDAPSAERPYDVTIPPAYDGGTALPMVVLLHGYSADAASQDLYFGLSSLARQRGFFVVLPNGLRNASFLRFWNATDACCAFGQQVDDVAYLTAVMDDMQRRFRIDPKRVYFAGHSNGGFMSHRMACERADRIAAIVSLAGAVWKDEAKCTPSQPVSVLQVHGTLDAVILYGGGFNATFEYPGAVETVDTWATKNGCSATSTTLTPDLDLVADLLGDETTRLAHDGCPTGGAAELWRLSGASHLPTFNSSWASSMYDWLLAHPKP